MATSVIYPEIIDDQSYTLTFSSSYVSTHFEAVTKIANHILINGFFIATTEIPDNTVFADIRYHGNALPMTFLQYSVHMLSGLTANKRMTVIPSGELRANDPVPADRYEFNILIPIQ